jgi:MraZ protein
MEIWNTEEWDSYVSGADDTFSEIVEEFAGRDLGT